MWEVFLVSLLELTSFKTIIQQRSPCPRCKHVRRGKIVVVVFEKSKVICGFLNVQDLALQLLYSLRVKYICKKCICVSACVFVCVFVYVVYVCTSCSKIVTIYLSLCARHFPDLSSSVTMWYVSYYSHFKDWETVGFTCPKSGDEKAKEPGFKFRSMWL